MKKLLFLSASIALFSCSQPTVETSYFANEIKDLDHAYSTMDSNYQLFASANLDTLVELRDLANKKYGTIKKTYQSEIIDTTFEKIMLIARGQLVKKIVNIEENSSKIKNEYTYTSEQYKALRENLIHEKLEKDESLIFYSEEKNALILLNAEIVNFNESIHNTISHSEVILPQMDSIIEVHGTKPE